MKHPSTAHGRAGWSADGWLHAAQRQPCPNHNARPSAAVVDLIVLHSISLPPGRYGGRAVYDLFNNQLDSTAHPYFAQLQGLEVSAHFFIRRNGQLWQFVATDQRAWHAGRSHYRGRSACNDDSIGIELEGLEGDTFTAAQYRCLHRLCQRLSQRHPIAFIAGHEHIAPGRKADPGAGFDWFGLRQAFAGSGILFPPATPARH